MKGSVGNGFSRGQVQSGISPRAYSYRLTVLLFSPGQVCTRSHCSRAEPIPCVLTMMGDEFGGGIPVGPFAMIGDDSIGRGIVETLATSRSPAVLMQNHGVFSIGKDARSAVKTAVMVEDVARTVHLSRQLGEPVAIAPADVDALYDRYQNVYGQGGPQ